MSVVCLQASECVRMCGGEVESYILGNIQCILHIPHIYKIGLMTGMGHTDECARRQTLIVTHT